VVDIYTHHQREIQKEFGTEKLASAHTSTIITQEIPEDHAAFISSRDFFFLSTVNEFGEPTVSYKGGAPGFVRVMDSKTLLFPSYDGNGMFLSMGNVAATSKIGLLFMDFETPHRVRLQASASILNDASVLESFPGAQLVVRAEVNSVFLNCGRYIHRHQRVDSSEYVPDMDGNQPFPAWKRIDHIQSLLPDADKRRAQASGGTITAEEYMQRVLRGEP
jgi:predicted pyridoxine 5'-phosphate oxidase superfamily flavin-nucleotide-binding protein